MKISVWWLPAAVAAVVAAHYVLRVDEADVRSVAQIRSSVDFARASPNTLYSVNPDALNSAPEYKCTIPVPPENLTWTEPQNVRYVNIWGYTLPIVAKATAWETLKDQAYWPPTILELNYRYQYMVIPSRSPEIPCEQDLITDYKNGMVICQIQHVFATDSGEIIGVRFRRQPFIPLVDGQSEPPPTCPLYDVEMTWKAKWDIVVGESL